MSLKTIHFNPTITQAKSAHGPGREISGLARLIYSLIQIEVSEADLPIVARSDIYYAEMYLSVGP